MENFKEQDKYMRAKERVAEMKKFYGNLTSYILVIGFLTFINWYTNRLAYPWVLWAAGGWGLGLLFHAAKAFGWNPMFNKEWEERKIREIMEKEQNEMKRQRWE
ncbi:2TM domain-containing protein [Robertkochia solimangrovi]|uniref:2TM domain-containing protein n=1 Tax=Robertkochia solimangrovi TaxID=2213046 RepID=UPI00117D3961|nr:2TM domain-containing protein [Robertkochia solimangrovi]TRZ42832.1 histidine kinase [Robertkochia solimangrovi]